MLKYTRYLYISHFFPKYDKTILRWFDSVLLVELSSGLRWMAAIRKVAHLNSAQEEPGMSHWLTWKIWCDLFLLLKILVIFDNFAAILPAKMGEWSFHWMLTVKCPFENTSYNLLPSDFNNVKTSRFGINLHLQRAHRQEVGESGSRLREQRGLQWLRTERPQLTDPTGKRCSKENDLHSFDWQSFLLHCVFRLKKWFPATAASVIRLQKMNGLTLTPMWGLFLI